jgi:hypothetical protein
MSMPGMLTLEINGRKIAAYARCRLNNQNATGMLVVFGSVIFAATVLFG